MKTAIMAGSTMSHRQTTGRKRRVLLWMMGLVLAWAAVCAHAGNTVTTVTLVMTDTQGNVLMTKDPQGHILARYTYRPYGTQQSGPTNAGPGYTGHVNDPGSGLVYMQQRYYDPGVGRFLSPDPIGPAAGNAFNFNRYAYANDNPLRYIDPTGAYTCVDNSGEKGNHYCSEIAKADGKIHSALGDSSLGARAHARLVKIAKLLGKPGEKNGVVIRTALGSGYSGDASVGGTANFVKPGVSAADIVISVPMKGFTASHAYMQKSGYGSDFSISLGAVLTHEGSHGVDERIWQSNPRGAFSEFMTEHRAYSAEAAYYSTFHENIGSQNLYSPPLGPVPSNGISTHAVMSGAFRSTDNWLSH
jgi:RHS repeat-associated protein